MIINNSVTTPHCSEPSGIKDKKIYLSDDNMSTHGFSRFYYPGEEELVNNVWLRDISIASSGQDKDDHSQFVLPADKLIPLSNEKKNKITSWQNFSINSGVSSITHISILSHRAGWNQTVEDVTKLVKLNHKAGFVASIRKDNTNIALGSGVVLKVSEKLNWIGMILVHPELRRQGIAKEIMKHCIGFARLDEEMPIIGLDATPMGMPLYTSLGFKESFRLWRSTLPTDVDLLNSKNVLVVPMTSIDSVSDYLFTKSLSDKLELFRSLFKLYKAGCFVAITGGKICGIILSRPGRVKPYVGHLIANSYKIAQALLGYSLRVWSSKGFDSVFIDIPEYHFEQKLLRDSSNKSKSSPKYCRLHSSIKPVREFVRMYQLINVNEVEKFLSVKSKDRIKTDKMRSYKKALLYALENHNETLLHMEIEKHKVLPYLYCIGGPEIS